MNQFLRTFFSLAVLLLAATSLRATPLVFEGTEGPGKGKHIVFMAGDHEYRSEETLPALGRLLAKHHGFKCTVLFNIDPATGEIVAGNSNMPGMEALDTADLVVVFTRFQHFPAEQMKHFDAYLNRGGPVVGMRTATHGFKTAKDDPYAKYSYDSKVAGYELGFGHQVLGQTWVGHYGTNHKQSTRITIVEEKKAHPILRGVKDIWVQVGGYVGKPTDGEILTMAQPLDGMTPDSPADAKKPPMPSEWTRTYKSASGKIGRVFTTLYGTSEDITNEGYRRLVVNGCFWAIGLEEAIRPDLNIALLGAGKPNTFNSGGCARGIKPEMYAGFESPIPANNDIATKPAPKANKKDAKQEKKAGKADTKAQPEPKSAVPASNMLTTGKPTQFVRIELPSDNRILNLLDADRKPDFRAANVAASEPMVIDTKKQGTATYLASGGAAAAAVPAGKPAKRVPKKKPDAPTEAVLVDIPAGYKDPMPFAFSKGEVVAILGNGLPDRFQHDGWMETVLQSALPEQQLRFRNLSASGDRPDSFPRSKGATSMTDYLQHVKADVVFAFFGYNESYDGKPDEHRKKLVDFVRKTRGSKANGKSFPRIVLFSPIAHEDTRNPNVPDGKAHNAQLEGYTLATEAAAKEAGVAYVDLFHPSLALFQASKLPLTINGIHLTEEGNRQIAEVIASALLGKLVKASSGIESLRAAVVEKDLHWFHRYRAADGNDVWGSRSTLAFVNGQTNADVLQHELSMLDVMTANRDPLIWARAQGKEHKVDDSNVPAPVPVVSNVGGGSKSSNVQKEGNLKYISGEEAIKLLSVAKGLKINLFADEAKFPQLANPVQMQVDGKGRLWAAVWPTYPKWEPLKPMNDALVIFHDDDADGKADRVTEFAKVHNPLGFEFWNGGVIVTCQSDLLFLKDTDGDDKADVRVVLLQGLDSSDTHHGANNLIYGPDGGIYWQSGIFMMHNYEHPWGPSLNSGASGMYRFDPRRFTISFHAARSPNPHGTAFDYWGNQYATDGTSGNAFQVRPDGKGFKMTPLLKKEVRPVTASEIVSSTHFPDAMQQDFLICNVIGFLGIKQYHLERNTETGAVWGEPSGDELDIKGYAADGTIVNTNQKTRGLLVSGDKNFRPSDAIVGADGSLFVSDWHNVIIGHMQHNVRDPNRDHAHGRIYRITAEGRPLQKPVAIDKQPIPALLENLKHPTDGVRHRTYIELSGRDSKEVIAALQTWIKQFDPNKKEDAHPLLQALWIHQQHNVRNQHLLNQLLKSPEPHARIAAQTVQHFWTNIEASQNGGVIADGGDEVAKQSGILSDTPTLTTIRIATIPEKMMYDTKQLAVKPGKKIKLTFANSDFMPHNILLVMPGKANEVGEKAAALGAGGFAVDFVPQSPDILWASKLIDYGEEQVIEFTAPTTEGAYPYICSFPGHHLMMRGTLIVSDNPAEFIAKNPERVVKSTAWKLADFTTEDLAHVGQHRNLASGKQSFTALACVTCHQFGKEGTVFGPNLGEVVKKYKSDPKAVLQEILEPSRTMDEKYRSVTLDLGGDNSITGMVIAEDKESMTIQTGPNAALVQKVDKTKINSLKQSPLSIMPSGLLNSLEKEQILDLLAYLLADGNADAPE